LSKGECVPVEPDRECRRGGDRGGGGWGDQLSASSGMYGSEAGEAVDGGRNEEAFMDAAPRGEAGARMRR
jgi:hypothetical protein